MLKTDHIEVSSRGTKIVASGKCPLKDNEIKDKQVFNGHIVCICEGQGQDFVCPYFYGAVYPSKKDGELYIDCRKKGTYPRSVSIY